MSPLVATMTAAGRDYGGRQVLRGVDLRLHAGEFVAVVGRSGSGKTTLLRILAGLDPHVTGDVRTSPQRMLVFQEPLLLPWLSVIDNICLGLARRSRSHATAVLAEVGLTGRERSWPATLSGGEAQRVALARALVRRPRLLLLDEPLGALDAITRLQMHGLLRLLHDAHRPGTLLVTHDIDEALALADRVLVLAGGSIAVEVAVDPVGRQAQRAELLAALELDGG